MTATAIAINSTFRHLTQDRSLRIKQNATSLEREAVVDITTQSTVYTTNGITLNFSKIMGFTQVYLVDVVHNGYVLPVKFVPASKNDAATGKMIAYDSSGVELGAGSTAFESKAPRCIIRGI